MRDMHASIRRNYGPDTHITSNITSPNKLETTIHNTCQNCSCWYLSVSKTFPFNTGFSFETQNFKWNIRDFLLFSCTCNVQFPLIEGHLGQSDLFKEKYT